MFHETLQRNKYNISAPIISNKMKDKHLKQEILAHKNTKQKVTCPPTTWKKAD